MRKAALKKLFLLPLILLLLLGLAAPAAAKEDSNLVRVGWFVFTGYQQYDENGRPYGYNYEYLEKIASITGWKYEFIDATREECTAMLKHGEIDIMGCMLSSPERRELFDFPQIDCGSTSTSLFTRSDSGIGVYDFAAFQGLTVGCCMGTKNDEDFLAFAQSNGFSAKLVNYASEPDLVMAVLNRQIDAGIACSRLDSEDIRVVASFSPEPFYFVTTKGNSRVLSGLNTALSKIKIDNSYYEKELAVKYQQGESPSLVSLINQLPSLAVIFFTAILLLLIFGLLWLVRRQAQSLATIKKLTYYDGLTGLYNKRGFEKRAKELLTTATQNQEYCIVAMDIVALRHINEFNGIATGNEVLKAVASVTAKTLQQGEIGARIAADDFVFLMHSKSREELTSRVSTAGQLFKATVKNQSVRISCGIYPITDRSMDIQYMYDYASFAMKSVDVNSGEHLAFFDNGLYSIQKENVKMLSLAEKAFGNGEFVPYYQPKFDSLNEKIVGAEALVRWVRADGSILAPGSFVELFEQNGYVTRLDFCVFEAVCKNLSLLIKKGLEPVPVSVNFSRAHLFNPAFPDLVADIAEGYKVPPSFLEIELTESAFTLESTMLENAVSHLHEHGFSVAIDDFGSGYSSLGLLKDVDADTLKLDMRFMSGFEKGGRVGIVVTSVVHMANWLGLTVVAEGVETREQADFIRSVGGDMIQGYYYAKPMPASEYADLLKTKKASEASSAISTDFLPGELSLLMGGNRLVSYLLNGLYVGFGFYEYLNEKLSILRVNDSYLTIMNATGASLHEYAENAINKIYEPDREAFDKAIKHAISTGQAVDVHMRRFNDTGKLLPLRGNILPIRGDERSALLCIFFNRIDEENDFCTPPPTNEGHGGAQ